MSTRIRLTPPPSRGAAGLLVGAIGEDVVGAIVARGLELVGLFPRILQLVILHIRSIPTRRIARAADQVIELAGQVAGVDVEIVDRHAELLRLTDGQLDLGTFARAEDIGGYQ